jgi:hypothetical protein
VVLKIVESRGCFVALNYYENGIKSFNNVDKSQQEESGRISLIQENITLSVHLLTQTDDRNDLHGLVNRFNFFCCIQNLDSLETNNSMTSHL